jgi:hypothetical protein
VASIAAAMFGRFRSEKRVCSPPASSNSGLGKISRPYGYNPGHTSHNPRFLPTFRFTCDMALLSPLSALNHCHSATGLRADKDENVWRAAADALTTLTHRSQEPGIANVESLRYELAYALGNTNAREAVPILFDFLASLSGEIIRAILRSVNLRISAVTTPPCHPGPARVCS